MASQPQSGIYIGTGGGKPQILELKRANRHGLIAGATGTGKTVTLQGHRRRAVGGGGPDLCRRREGRPRRARDAGQCDVQDPRSVHRPRRRDRLFRLAVSRQSGAILGFVRRAGPPGPHHGQRDGAAAPRPADEFERGPGRRADDRFPCRRQGRAVAARPRRSAGDAAGLRRARRRADADLWQCFEAVDRRDPAVVAPAARPGRRQFLRRAGARSRGFPQARREWPRDRQHPRRRPAVR